jgi:hypothetical protein
MATIATLVRVIQPDTFGVGKPIVQLWAAAVPREQAVEAVLKNFPPGWKAEISENQLTQDQIAGLTLRSGKAIDYSRAKHDH